MRFIPTTLQNAYLIEPEIISDERGFFARTFCRDEFAAKGLNYELIQCNISYNKECGTLRGMHYQKMPHAEVKLVRCTRGRVFDVIIDLRPESHTFTKWFGTVLTAENKNSLYVPEGFAHGFLTLCDDVEMVYQMSEFYYAEYTTGVRWNDPTFAISWPSEIKVISKRDSNYPDYKP